MPLYDRLTIVEHIILKHQVAIKSNLYHSEDNITAALVKAFPPILIGETTYTVVLMDDQRSNKPRTTNFAAIQKEMFSSSQHFNYSPMLLTL